MPDQVRHDRIQNLVLTVSVVVGIKYPNSFQDLFYLRLFVTIQVVRLKTEG